MLKSTYMVISRDRYARRSHSLKTSNNSFERVEGFKYIGKTLKFKFLLRKKLRKVRIQGIFAIIRCRIF